MNDLRLLYQVDPTRKVITLQHKQITSLDPMIPLLVKFQNLQSLSLQDNRLKRLPLDMSELGRLQQLDIRNNLFTNIQEIVTGLKTLPSLTHLLMNFKNSSDENYIKNELKNLQKINNKVVVVSEHIYSNKKNKINNIYELTQSDLQNGAKLYDQVRQIYKDSKYMVDHQLANDFDSNIEIIMQDIAHKNRISESQIEVNCNNICGKYGLIDLCFVKLITYFYHFDKKIAVTLEKIHDYQAELFQSITNLVLNQENQIKKQVTNIRTKKEEIYKAEIRRLKNYQEENSRQIENLENKNRELLDKLIKYTKTSVMEDTMNNILKSNRSPHKNSKAATNQKVTVRNKPKVLTSHQLKQIMSEIYKSKKRQNQNCIENGLELQTMETHMYTYLNQKYGLKSLEVEWAMNIVNSIRRYGIDDPVIGTFGKILRNQVEESFPQKLALIKDSLYENIKKLMKNFEGKGSQEFSIHLAEEVLLNMGWKREQTSLLFSRIPQENISNNIIKLQFFEKSVFEFYARKHDEKITNFHKQFKKVDLDEDGMINSQQLQNLMKNVNDDIDINQVILMVDPSSKGIITYSSLLQFLLKVPECKDYFKGE